MKLPQSSKKLKQLKNPLVLRRIQGHSMLPVLPPGTLVWGRRWHGQLKIGDVVIFLHEGKEKIKRISELNDGTMFVLGDHPETSTDSRQFGWLGRETIIAKIFWPHAPKDRANN